MRTVNLSSNNNNNLVVNNSIIADSLDISQINVANDVYINSESYTPVGSILTYAGTTSPSGWLLCDGSEVSKTVYSRLFSVIGNLYGIATNGDNFVLPNLSDRVPVGKTNSNAVGNSGGNSSVTLSVSQLPSHTHTGTTVSNGSHRHTGTTVSNGSHSHTGTTDTNGSHSHTINDPGHTHSQTTINDDFNSSGGYPPGFVGDSAGSRTWYNINSATTGITINSSGSHTHTFTSDISGSHTHTFTSDISGSHTHTFTTDSTGSGSQVDIRNKYIVMNYIIRY